MLHLKHQPTTWDGYVESSPDVAKLRAAIDSGRLERGAVLIQGPSSSGKTTLAGIIAAQLANDWIEINGANCSAEKVRELATGFGMSIMPWMGKNRVVLINECQSMTDKAVEIWLDVLDKLKPNSFVLFTTTEDCRKLFGEFGEPFVSRCRRVMLNRPPEAKAIARLREICQAENIEATDWQLGELLRREGRNLRACIDRLDDLPEDTRSNPIVNTAKTPAPTPKTQPDKPIADTVVDRSPGASVPTTSPPQRLQEEIDRERYAAIAERARRIMAQSQTSHEQTSQPTAPAAPPKAVAPPMSPQTLVELLSSHGTKCNVQQADILLATCNGSIEALENLVKLPLRAIQKVQADKPIRGGVDHRKKAKAESRKPAPEDDDPRPTSDPETWRVIVPSLVVLLWVSWPWVSLAADLAIWSTKTAISVFCWLDK